MHARKTMRPRRQKRRLAGKCPGRPVRRSSRGPQLSYPPDGTPVDGLRGLVWWAGHAVPEFAMIELSAKETNGWLRN